MGRISLPFLNKTGYSMFWDSMWDDKHNYNKLIKEDIFLKICIPLIFDDYPSNNLIFYLDKDKFFQNNLDIYNIVLKIDDENDLKSVYNFLKSDKIEMFSSKIWILRFQGWVIIYVFVYVPIFNNFFTESDNNEDFDFHYYNIFFNYYFNLIKLNYKNNFFNSQITNKNSF